jgi:hypothetical protein
LAKITKIKNFKNKDRCKNQTSVKAIINKIQTTKATTQPYSFIRTILKSKYKHKEYNN